MRVLLAFLAIGSAAAEIPKPDDAPLPKSPAESAKHFTLPEGFRIDLIAAEPLIRDPSCVAWDPQGRLFVTEIHGYNLEGHLDVTELNKKGELATAIERVRVGPEMKAEAQKGQTGSLKLLRDVDGDGLMDEALTWASDIPAAYGVVTVHGGVIITAAPDIIYFADTDGDDMPDVRETLYTGFGLGEMERGINNPVWGPDGWIYAGQGWGGGTITGPRLKGEVKLGRTDFRFLPDGSAIEPVSGSNSTFGMAFDDVGNRYLITTSTPSRYAVPLPYRYLKRNPHVPTPDLTATASNYHQTFPTSRPHPWRQKRGADPRWVKFYGAGEAKPNGNFTSGCGQQIYRASLFPEKYHGNYFSCDPQQSMVHRALISRDGPGITVRRPPEHADNEFLTSSDGWFRPNNLRVGPDGALYIVDMYREIIEDYSAIPRYLQQQYGLLNGDDRGRIWRLAPEDSPPGPITRAGYEPAKPVAGVIAALYEKNFNLKTVLQHENYAVRLHGLRAGDGLFATDPESFEAALALVDSEKDPSVLLQLAMSLGESDDPRAASALARLAAEHGGIRWMDSAILSSINGRAGAFLKVAFAEHPEIPVSILERAAVTAARTGDAGALAAAIDHPDEGLRLRLLALAAEQGEDATPELRRAADRALSRLDGSERERLAALRLLPFAQGENATKALDRLLLPTENPEFQARGIALALSTPQPAIAGHFITRLPELTPRAQALVVEALLAHPGTAKQLLGSKLDMKFSALQHHRLRNHEDEAIRRMAMLATLNAVNKVNVLSLDGAYRTALSTHPDLERGQKLFGVHCATCHQLDGVGVAVGPPLDAEAGRPPESLLAAVLQPSAEITAGYASYVAKTSDGASHAGVLVSESATSISLAQAGGVRVEVLRKNLESLKPLDISLMPANLTELLKPKELADIIAFIRQRDSSGSRLLFDDDPAFPSVLHEGDGSAKLDWRDAASGRACITVSGFQRYSRNVPGWNFAIREEPAQGEFRFLRIALKTRTAKGMMIELADKGSFPPNDKPVRTWYAGENGTDWNSNQLAEEIPAEWKSFTIDMWECNGGNFELTGIALTTMRGVASYDRIELLREKP